MSARPVVLVTGAARRLGRAIALHLARQGHDVAVHYHRSQADARRTVDDAVAAGAAAAAFAADLADEAACRALVPAVVTHFGRLDAVVNNASLFEPDHAADFSYAAMERHWRANTAPAVVLAQALHEHLAARGASAPGCVVNLLDQKLWNPNPDCLSYTLSKAALECATTLLAQALAPRVRVCGVAPGLTLGSAQIDDARLAQLQARALLGYGARPDDIAHAVHFLLTARASTGTTVLVDAGQHLQPHDRDFGYLA
jgi:NAD(P)-dependent dehydrogenase (short-subunit alcohol dehydrogenase family)